MQHLNTTSHQPAGPSTGPRRRGALLGSAALAGLVVAGAVWLAGQPALTLLGTGTERGLGAGVAMLRLAETTGRLAAATSLLADARTGADRLNARADLRMLMGELTTLATEVASLNRAMAEGLRRPLSGMETQIGDLDRAVEARIAVDAELHNALTQVPERRAALRAALGTVNAEALQAGPRNAELLGLRDAAADRSQRLAARLTIGGNPDPESQEAFRADARELEALLARLPISTGSATRSEAARRLMALGLDTGNIFELRWEQANLVDRITGLMRKGRIHANEISLLARRTADGLLEAVRADRAEATPLLRAAPALAGALAGLAVLVTAERHGTAKPAPPEPEVQAKASDEAPPGLRILLAEDERMTQAVAAALLRRSGHTVTVVDDGRAALEAVQAQPFDLVLLDLRMPAMDGVEALRRIRALPDRAKATVRIVVLTASAVPEDTERCRAAGADAVLAKPLRLDALLPVLEGRPPQPAGDEVPVFDDGALEQMLDALPAGRVAVLIGGTLRALGDYRAAVRSAWAEGDRATLGAMAHKVAGVAGVYGCPALRQAAQALERGIETGEGDAASLMDALEAAYGPAIEALEQKREMLPSLASGV